MAAPALPLSDYTGVPTRQFFTDLISMFNFLLTQGGPIDMTGAAPAISTIPDGYGLFRYASGGSLTFYCNDGGVLKGLIFGTPAP